MSYGLKSSFEEKVYRPWRAMRTGGNGRVARNVSIEDYITKYADGGKGLTTGHGNPITMANVWQDFGINPLTTTIKNLTSTGDQSKWLAPVAVLGFIIKGLMARPWWQGLCKASIPVPHNKVDTPYLSNIDMDLEETGEGETLAVSTQKSSEKTVGLPKYARAIYHSNELLLNSPLPLIQPWYEELGWRIAANRSRRAVQALVNGDGGRDKDGNLITDSVAVVGVKTPATLAFGDWTKCWARGAGMYLAWHTMVTSEDTGVEVLEIDKFTQPQAGSPLVQVESQSRIMPDAMGHYQSSIMTDGDVLLLDKEWALLHCEFLPPDVDEDKIFANQLHGTSVTVIDGFVTIKREARVMMRKSLDISAAGFPTWMGPLD